MRRRSAPPRKTGRREGCGNGGCYVSQTEQQASKESGIVGGGKVEIQNQDSHFSTAPTACGSKEETDRKSTRPNSSHRCSAYGVFCLKKKSAKPRGCAPVAAPFRNFQPKSKEIGR